MKVHPSFEIKDSDKDLINRESNIFLKADNFVCNKEDENKKLIIRLLRIISGCIILFAIATNFQLNSSLTTVRLYSQKYLTYMAVYRIPMILGNNYYKSILGIGDQVKVKK